jgi:hypothetical protein
MNPEPLKGKVLNFNGEIWEDMETRKVIFKRVRDTESPLFAEEDVRSAVEWLKSEIKKDSAFFPKGNLYLLIDEAFEDVVVKK